MTDNTQVTTVQTPTELIALGIEKGLDVASLEKLMDLQERWEAKKALKAFHEAMGEFQKNCPVLKKSKRVKFETKTGGLTEYNYTPLPAIIRQIKDLLAKHGFTYKWKSREENNKLFVTCIITHKDGHSEETELGATFDKSGSKNDIQATGSSFTYLERYSLCAALGITTADSDQDGQIIQKSVDELHKEFMAILNPLIQKDSKWNKFDPDNWKGERTPENYLKAIADLKQKSGVS